MVAKLKLTYEDYQKTPDDVRYELIDGELVIMPSPREIHQRLLGEIGFLIYMFVKEHSLGQVYFAPLDVVLSNTTVLQPDLMFISNERTRIITEDNIQGAPDLAVEILSPSNADNDRIRKRALYAQHGVKGFWLVDPYAKNVTVLLLGNHGFEVVGIYGEGQTLTSPTLASFALDLDTIFQGR